MRAGTDRIVMWNAYATPWGDGVVAGGDEGITMVMLPSEPLEVLLTSLKLQSSGRLREGSDITRRAAEALGAYFRGGLSDVDVPLCWEGITPFRRRVMEAAERIPAGEVRTYGWLAECAGSPRAARACGQVMARNPFPIVIPCHRVVAAGGGLGGFSSGLHWKQRLLELEGAGKDRGGGDIGERMP